MNELLGILSCVAILGVVIFAFITVARIMFDALFN